MPYIKPEERDNLDLKKGGHVNYLITKTIHEVIMQEGISYNLLADIVEVLDGKDVFGSAWSEVQVRLKHALEEVQQQVGKAYGNNWYPFYLKHQRMATKEFYDTVVRQYEDTKRKENGSVSILDKLER